MQLKHNFKSSPVPVGSCKFSIGDNVKLMGSEFHRGTVLEVRWEPRNDRREGGCWNVSIPGCYGPEDRFISDE